jgi:hypothetical protein
MDFTPTKVLITVMTYPLPSRGYQEVVCAAGITAQGEWVRLYPIPYRYNPCEQQFHKYQWIEVGLASRGSRNDQRKESRRPNIDSIRILGKPLPTDGNWRERRLIIDKMPIYTRIGLEKRYEQDKTSLGILRPKKILDLEIRKADGEWSPKQQAALSQLRLFGPPPKPLKKIPFTFHYVFECEDSEQPHTAMCEDWELGVLYLKEEDRLGCPEKAAESVKRKFFDDLCSDDKDTRFFMGTFHPYNTWLVLGLFYPRKAANKTLW